TVIGSFVNSFPRENISNMRKIVNGRAETSEADCNASNLPAYSNTAAIADMRNPHVILTISGGNKLPLVVILASIYVAESADLIKNVKMSTMARNDITPVNGKCFSVSKIADVTSASTASAIFVPLFKSLYNAVP